jgi:hypothetical protein
LIHLKEQHHVAASRKKEPCHGSRRPFRRLELACGVAISNESTGNGALRQAEFGQICRQQRGYQRRRAFFKGVGRKTP